MIQKKRIYKITKWTLAITFISMNVVAIFHAYKFTHFADSKAIKTKDAKKLSATEKISTLIFGINNPRPENDSLPTMPYETIKLQSNRAIECWQMKTDSAKGTVILFHGFSGDKASLLDKANIFLNLRYNVFMVDFMGSGGSEGNQTTIGFLEAAQVKTCYEYIKSKGETNILLFGTSMGAAAIMKSINDNQIAPQGIILECPFGSMYQTVCARFKNMNAPTFPMAGLLVFWGGIENGFWAFGHNPEEYAKNINCPTLLMYGALDDKVSVEETNEIYKNLKGDKVLKTYTKAGHENYLIKYKKEWIEDVTEFLQSKD